MEAIWFWLVALMLAGYVVLDGYDIGAGIVHLLIARSDLERRQILESIGPFWDGNEVWLIAGGGTLYFAFPGLYASSFSGFYLPLMIVLWLLMLRGISIEVRNHIDSPVWKPFWDVIFAGASVLLAIDFGAALGNVVRGAPLDVAGDFFLPLWTTFRPSGYGPGRYDRSLRAIAAWSIVGASQDRRPSADAVAGPGRQGVVAGGSPHRNRHDLELRRAAPLVAELYGAPVGICVSGPRDSRLRGN